MTAPQHLNVSQPEKALPEHRQIKHRRDSTIHFWKILSLNTRFLSINKSTSLRNGTTHFEQFAPWKQDSWASANQLHCCTALPIYQHFAPCKRSSWTWANQPSCRMVLLLSERFGTWKCLSWLSASRPACNFTQSKSERCESLKTEIVNIGRTTIFQDSTNHIWTLTG